VLLAKLYDNRGEVCSKIIAQQDLDLLPRDVLGDVGNEDLFIKKI
jgi:hypothetical protein